MQTIFPFGFIKELMNTIIFFSDGHDANHQFEFVLGL